MDTKEIQAGLQAYFYADEVEWKIQVTSRDKTRALMVGYIQSRAIMNRLDEVMGIDGWRDEYASGPNGGVICGLALRFDTDWITKWDGADNTNIEAVKGGLTDAFKRAGVKWGIGRYLYSLPGYWVDLDDKGKPATEPQLPPVFLPADADRNGRRPVAGNNPAPQQRKPAQPVKAQPAGNGGNGKAEKAPTMNVQYPEELEPAPARISVASARAMTGSDGKKYGELDTPTLAAKFNHHQKQLKKADLTPEEREDHQLRADALQCLIDDRKAVKPKAKGA